LKQYDSILIIGSGGREHSLGWKLSNDTGKKVYFAPGNAGTENNINIDSSDLLSFLNSQKRRMLLQ